MKIVISDQSPKGVSGVSVVHNDEVLSWDIKAAYHRATDPDMSDGIPELERYDHIFNDINAYWDWLPDDRQDKIWNAYKAIHETLMSSFDATAFIPKLQRLIAKLYDLMPHDEIKHWMLFYSEVRIPSTLKSTLSPNDTPERTYLRDDYVDLVVLALAVRPMVPIWGEYITRTRNDHGTTYKESMAMRLMYYSWLSQCGPIERLRVYIESSVEHSNQQGQSFSAIMGGLGTTELPDWLLATTVVRRISIVPLTSPDDAPNIIQNIHQYITNTLRSLDRRFKGRISPKNPPANTGDSENVSLVEMYKVKQEVPDGDVVVLNVYTEQPFEMLRVVDETVPPALLETTLKHITALEQLSIQPHQTVLTQYVMSPCLPPRGIPMLQKQSVLRAMAVSQAVLWHWGFFDLAGLITAEPIVNSQDMMIGILESRGRIPRETMDQLVELYPHQLNPRGKSQSVRQTNVASNAIDKFCELVVRNDWMLHAPPELIQLTSRIASTRKMIVPPDIRAQLGRLIVHIRSRENTTL